jgi:hypothetical protein
MTDCSKMKVSLTFQNPSIWNGGFVKLSGADGKGTGPGDGNVTRYN